MTAKVAVENGVPRILINGKPERARIFFGRFQPGAINIGNGWQEVQFTFTPLESSRDATVHIRFGQKPGDVFLDDIRIVDEKTGQPVVPHYSFEAGGPAFEDNWGVWPRGDQNTVASCKVVEGAGHDGSRGLKVTLSVPRDGIWPDFHIYHKPNLTLEKGRTYRMSFWARSTVQRDLTVAFYDFKREFLFLGGPQSPYQPQVRLAAKAGVRMVSVRIPFVWPAPGEAEDWGGVDTRIEATLEANPGALIIPRIAVQAPDWWNAQHPEELMRWRPERPDKVASVSSELFVQEASARLKRMVEYIESKYGGHVVGYHPCGQATGEWFYIGSWDWPLNGYGAADARAFRSWLRAKYGSDAALQAAWRDPQATLQTAAVPSEEARRKAANGVFRDPATERPVLDFVEFQQKAMADAVCSFARAIKEASKGRKLVLAFYGYLFEMARLPTGPATSGHYALRRVLDSPDIDIVCAPISYFDRGRGEYAPCMSAAESVALAGKMWLNEDDTRTHLVSHSDFPGQEHVLTSLEQTNELLARNVAQASLRHFGTWWMDLGATGWFNHPGYWDLMKRLEKLDGPMLARGPAFRPEIALVVDEKSGLLLNTSSEPVSRSLISESRRALGRSGAPYGQYLLDDVLQGRVDAKLYVFLNAWKLSAEERKKLLQKTRGRTVVWCYAPGWFDGDTPSLEAMRELTGFTMRSVRADSAQVSLEGPWKGSETLGVNLPVAPLFGADPRDAVVLAKWPGGLAAVAQRRWNGGHSIFVAPPALSPNLIRHAAKLAGAHLFTETDCNVYANGPFVALHASQDGDVELNTGSDAEVRDVLTGKSLGRGPNLVLPMRRSETRVLQIRPDEPGTAGKPASPRARARRKPGAQAVKQGLHGGNRGKAKEEKVVEMMRFELTTSAVRLQRSPS